MSLLPRLWRLEGTLNRAQYAAAGVVGFAVKYALDLALASLIFGQRWSPLSYWRLIRLSGQEGPSVSIAMFVALFGISLPFLWFAMATTLLRLRDAGRSAGWAALLFVPVLNLILFITLVVLPTRAERRRELSPVVESALFAVIASVAVGTAGVAFATHALATYGIGLFVAVPFCVGYLSAFLHRRRHPTAAAQPFAIAFVSVALLGGFLIALAWEGLLCLVMSLPLGLLAAFIGAYVGSRSAAAGRTRGSVARSSAVVAALPLFMLGEALVRDFAPQYRVDTTVVIDAPIERVWGNVVAFSDIPAEPEWYFRAGIAYPVRARIDGRGAGATRYCEFTTGSFVEPIELWHQPRLLRFAVATNPPPLKELSPYENVHAPHLDSFLVSRRGQFALRALSGSQTEVIGTTWYQHHLFPAAYWTLWSDAIIHRIHLRVLKHVKYLSELPRGATG